MIRRLLSLFTSRTDTIGSKPVTIADEYHIRDSEDEPDADAEDLIAKVTAWLADDQRRRDLDRVDDLDLPIQLRQRLRNRVLAGERLIDIIGEHVGGAA